MNNNGWIKSTDPDTGRTFYANKHTRTTQWEVPEGWDELHKETGIDGRNGNGQLDADHHGANHLPTGWEESVDPKSGRTFYINHLEKKTTWERPVVTAADGYSSLNALAINKFGSHTKWVDPTVGSRYSNTKQVSSNRTCKEPPLLEYKTVQVPDSRRPCCPNCRAVFTALKRRHHCRLCGDIYCDGCSQGRAVLPLDGEEFNRSVRVCDLCLGDVKRGNYFTWRRYLTPLQLYNPKTNNHDTQDGDNDITIDMVAASLSSLSVDLDAILSNPHNNLESQVTISADILIPAVGRHLSHRMTAEYAIRVLASLIMLGNILDDDSFALAIYGFDRRNGSKDNGKINRVKSYSSMISVSSDESRVEQNTTTEIIDGILSVLEWSGSDDRTIGAQEQAAKILFYVSDPKLIAVALTRGNVDEEENIDGTNDSRPVDVDAVASTDIILELDIHRAFRAMFDHTTNSSSTTLQRWATASLRHLIIEDQRRACIFSSGSNKYQSFSSQLVSTGGVMILCSLLASDDSDTRVYATSALEAFVVGTREIEVTLNKSNRQSYRVGTGTKADSMIVDDIVANGGCGNSLAQLLISSDESIAMKGCAFALSLMAPLLSDPRGSNRMLHICTSAASSGITFDSVDDGLNSYKHAALALAVGDGGTSSGQDFACIPSLIQIMKSAVEQTYPERSITLQIAAGKCLAAIALAISDIVCAVNSKLISGTSPLCQRAKRALQVMEKEQLYAIAYQIATSLSLNTLNPSRNTPQAQLREAVGLVLFAVTACSNISAEYLISARAVSELLRLGGESGMLTATSTFRGVWACRGLCFLEAATVLMIHGCKFPRATKEPYNATSLDLLIDAVDSGAIGIVSRTIKAKVNLQNHDLAHSQIRVKIACCMLLSAMFEMSSEKESLSGKARLYDAIDADCSASIASNDAVVSKTSSRMSSISGRSDLFASTITLLQATIPFAEKILNQNSIEHLPMIDLSEACLLAVGGMCGARSGCFASDQTQNGMVETNTNTNHSDKYTFFRQDICKMAFDALDMDLDQGKLLPAVLVGGLGGSCIIPMLRLLVAISENGKELGGKLMKAGIVPPVSDILLSSLSAGNIYTTLLCTSIVRHCGCAAGVGNIDTTSSSSLSDSIRTISSLITQRHQDKSPDNLQHILQLECLTALEAISTNTFLSSSIFAIALPDITRFLEHNADKTTDDDAAMCSALSCVLNIAPAHALKVAKSGIVSVLAKLINARFDMGINIGNATIISLQILHKLSQDAQQVRSVLISSGVIYMATKLLEIDDLSSDEKMTTLGTVSQLVSDLFATPHLKEPGMTLLFEIKERKTFMRKLIATMMSREQQDCHVPIEPFYGSSFPVEAHNAAARLLTQITWLFCQNIISKEYLFNVFMLNISHDTAAPTVAFACCSFIRVLDNGMLSLGSDENGQEKSHLIIKQFLLEILSISLEKCAATEISRGTAEEIVRVFRILETCMSLSQTVYLASEAFCLFEKVLSLFGKDFIGQLLVNDKTSFVALLDIVTGGGSHTETFARILGNLANDGLISAAVAKFGLRNRTIAALSAAIALDADDEKNIEESDSNLSRVCLECLASVLSNEQNHIEVTDKEACTMASTIGKILSSTVLHRFYIQASREDTLDSVDHNIDRIVITSSSEARILCAIASSRESLVTLNTVGGLEAISLLAHDGEVVAIRALRKACELDPRLITSVDAHLSVLDALRSMRYKIKSSHGSNTVLREVSTHCLAILHSLASMDDTRSVIFQAENCSDALEAAMQIITVSEKCLSKQSTCTIDSESQTVLSRRLGIAVDQNDIEKETDRAHYAQLGPYQGDEIQRDVLSKEATPASTNPDKTATHNIQTDGAAFPCSNVDSLLWDNLLIDDDFTLERAALSLMHPFLASKAHREKVITNDQLVKAVIALAQKESPAIVDLRCDAMELTVALTRHVIQSSDSIAEFLISMIETQTKVLKGSRDMNELSSSKKIAALSVSGLQNLICIIIDDDLRNKAIHASSDLFVYLVDSLYVGPKSKRAVSLSDGILLEHLTSLFLSTNGNSEARKILSSDHHISSMIRFIVMASGAESSFVLATGEGSDYFDAALELCILCLSYMANGLSPSHRSMNPQTSQTEKPLVLLIKEVEPHPGVFSRCIEHLSDDKLFSGASRVAAKKLIETCMIISMS